MSSRSIIPILLKVNTDSIEILDSPAMEGWILPKERSYTFKLGQLASVNIHHTDEIIFHLYAGDERGDADNEQTDTPVERADDQHKRVQGAKDLVKEVVDAFFGDPQFSVLYYVARNICQATPSPKLICFEIQTDVPEVKNLPWEWLPWINSGDSPSLPPEEVAFVRIHSGAANLRTNQLHGSPRSGPLKILVFNIIEKNNESQDRKDLINLARFYENDSSNSDANLVYRENSSSTLDELKQCVNEGYDIVHIITHGVSERVSTYPQGLPLKGWDNAGNGKAIYPQDLVHVFHEVSSESRPLLVLLTVCYSGAPVADTLFPDIASTLSGVVPAVIGMQTRAHITDMVTFCQNFYRNIFDATLYDMPLSVVELVQRGRETLGQRSNYAGVIAGMPILYLQTPFDVSLPTTKSAKPGSSIKSLNHSLDMKAFNEREHNRVHDALVTLQRLYPNNDQNNNGKGNDQMEQAWKDLREVIIQHQHNHCDHSARQMLAILQELRDVNNWYLIQHIGFGRPEYNRNKQVYEADIEKIFDRAEEELKRCHQLKEALKNMISSSDISSPDWKAMGALGKELSKHPVYSELAKWFMEKAGQKFAQSYAPGTTFIKEP